MSEWRSHTFGELIDDGVLLVSDGYRAKLEELVGDGPLFLRAGHVSDSHIDFTDVERFHAEVESRVRGKMSEPGDVVITTKGNSTGRVAYVNESFPPFVYSPHLSFWRSLKPVALIPSFLRYWSRGEEFQQQLRALACATDMAPYLSLIDQRRLRLTLPAPEEQRAIASVLGALDDKIELNRRMNETLEALAQSLFQSWFVDATQAGLPEGWSYATISGLCDINSWTLNKGDKLDRTVEEHLTVIENRTKPHRQFISGEAFEMMCQTAKEAGYLPKALDIGIAHYVRSFSFDIADGYFQAMIKPYLANFTEQHLLDLLAGIEANGQTYG